ncbi:aldo/keto reductase [Actinoplanes sp. M2I2]|uniref:aldo/keto reductase n=1 Tax=Actinoplanes sp. M2I2 TaxID=1734444 RepID=UPI0020214D97|nr:aldo/keto reductase [Actinoplanes sp. M2I2]
MAASTPGITRAGTVDLGGKIVNRLGFGAMRLADADFWGPPADRDSAIRVARRAVELGVNFIDTADSYSLGGNEELLREALHPYPEHLLIATKAGQTQPRRREWVAVGRPEYLRQQCELSLRRLRVDRIDLYQLHRVDPQVPFEDQIGELRNLRDEGKIRAVGLSEVDVPQIEAARQLVDVVSVQNMYNLAARDWEAVVDYCTRERIAFIPWFPMMSGTLSAPQGAVTQVAAETGATAAQVALAWLLARADVMLPIPGTSSIDHLEENVAAAGVVLTPEQIALLSASPVTTPAP